jgi:glycosyltransferase involved in cell wall biosynthesis/GT2 family glycosyltransferase
MLTAPTSQASDSMPFRILEVELGRPLPTLSAIDEKTGQHYRHARCLVRLHDHPLGIVEIQFHKNELDAQDYVQHIWCSLHVQILSHLQQDGLAAITELEPGGLSSTLSPLCIEERETFFAAAPFVSVIISTHDRPERLSRGLPALLAQDYPRYEVIIVDNAPSTNATADLIKQTYDNIAKLRYIREDCPGLSRGLNRGVMEATGGILAFTDDDVIVDSYWLLQLVKAFSLSNDVACVTGLVLPLELETPAQILFEEYGGFSKGFRRRVYDMAKNHPREPLFPYTAGRFGTGASMAFRATFLRSAGGFDVALKCGMDIALFFQVIKQGHTLVYEPAALAYHAHRRSYAELRNQIYDYGVALTAYLTKSILEQPRSLFELATKVPSGLIFLLSPRSSKNRKKLAYYPRELTMLEFKGMLHGPFAYIHKRRQLTRREPFHPVRTLSAGKVTRGNTAHGVKTGSRNNEQFSAGPGGIHRESTIRILLLTQFFYPPTVGGEERHIADLSLELAARGHDVSVVTLWQRDLPEFEIDRGVRIHRIRGMMQRMNMLFSENDRQYAPPFPDPEVLWKLRRIIQEERPEIIHAHNWLVHSFTPLKQWSKVKLVVSLHDYSLVCVQKRLMRHNECCTGPGLMKCMECATRFYGAVKGPPSTLANFFWGEKERQVVDMFLPVSQAVVDGTRLDKHKVPYRIIPNFLPEQIDTVCDDAHPLLAQLPQGDFMLFVGDVTLDKGAETLLQAYTEMDTQVPLVLIGRSFLTGTARSTLPPNVLLMGRWPHDVVMAAWSRCSIGLVPSIVAETFGIVALEAMYMSKPVIAARSGGLIDVVIDGVTGFLVPPGDPGALRQAMQRLLDDPIQRARMGAAAKQQSMKFQAQSVIPRIEQVYRELLGKDPITHFKSTDTRPPVESLL